MTTEKQGQQSFSTQLNTLLAFFNYALPEYDPTVSNLVLDSRQIKPGDVFIALPGYAVDGRQYINSAINAGTVAVFAETATESDVVSCEYRANIPVIYIPALSQRVSELAGLFFQHPSKQLKVIAVTGTNGKTTCAHLLLQLFQQLGERAATIGTIGYGTDLSSLSSTGLTTPDAIECQRILASFVAAGVKYVSMEVSSHAIAQARVRGVHFEGAIYTNLTRDHLDFHGSMDAYAAEKVRLFTEWPVGFAVLNIDTDYSETFLKAALSKHVSVTGYGVANKVVNKVANEAEKHAATIESGVSLVVADNPGFSITGLSSNVRTPEGQFFIEAALLGRFNLYNLLAVISAVRCLNYPMADIVRVVKNIEPISGRMQVVDTNEAVSAPSDICVCVDYAHTPDALEQALHAAREHTGNKLCVVFGCGGERDTGKRPLMGKIAEQLADYIVVTSDNPRTENPANIIEDVVAGISRATHFVAEADRKKAILNAVSAASPGDLVLIAGKGHEDYQIIGHSKIDFSDIDIARHALLRRNSRLHSRQEGDAL